jgi:hypothetical protein
VVTDIEQAVVAAPTRAITKGKPHFFGYYDKTPWSADGQLVLACEADFQDRPPTPTDALRLGVIDTATNTFDDFAQTTAWSWQQGTMLQWLPTGEVAFNDRDADGIVRGVVLDLSTGARRQLERGIYAVSPNGRDAVGLNFHRIQSTRPGYGYPPAEALPPERWAPDDDGMWHIDLLTGESRLVLSLEALQAFDGDERARGNVNYINHAVFNTDGSRLCFFHLWKTPYWLYEHTLRWCTMAPDGSDLRVLDPYSLASHFAWRSPHEIVGWAFWAHDSHEFTTKYERWYEHDDPRGRVRGAYWLLDDRTGEATVFAPGVLPNDGHMSWSPDGRWLVTDEYANLPGNEGVAPLLLYDIDNNRRYEIARFREPLVDELRCDLHARWNRSGTQICVDSAHDGTRQMYVVDVADIVG